MELCGAKLPSPFSEGEWTTPRSDWIRSFATQNSTPPVRPAARPGSPAAFGFLALFLAFLFLAPTGLSALGRAEPETPATLRDEWVLVVTRFDHSALPAGQQSTGEMLIRNLIAELSGLNYRLRLSPETDFYEGSEWRRLVQAAALSLAAKQDERSRLLFRGDPDWRYRRDLRRLDQEIETLAENLRKLEEERPDIDIEPVFVLAKSNLEGTFPQPPAAGTERRFVREQSADAFLAGEVLEFHGRFLLRVRLWALYRGEFVYRDDVIFSLEYADAGIAELAGRLTEVIAGNPHARIAVTASPGDAQILIDRAYAGTGEVPETARPPGKIAVAVAAEGHIPKTVELDLAPGERTALEVTLGRIPLAEAALDGEERTSFLDRFRPAPRQVPVPEVGLPEPSGTETSDPESADPETEGTKNAEASGAESESAGPDSGIAVYRGALYVGQAPLRTELPLDSLAYFTMERFDGRSGGAVFVVPALPDGPLEFSLKLGFPKEEGRVNKARGRYYWSWAGFWGAIVAAWISSGNAAMQIAQYMENPGPERFADAQRAVLIQNVSVAALFPTGAYMIFEMIRYLGASNSGSVPIVRRNR
ncbi:MAG: hypothetical protein FWD94_01515 [Treponema sp.]|nr:hypothetical protein [Treponema sp.]